MRFKESLNGDELRSAKSFWKKLCNKYKNDPDGFSDYINQEDGDFFFELMAKSMGYELDVEIGYEDLEDMQEDFYEKVTDPIEISVFGEPISSEF